MVGSLGADQMGKVNIIRITEDEKWAQSIDCGKRPFTSERNIAD